MKLSFKGDTHKKKPKTRVLKATKEEEAEGWCTATSLSDVSGPIVIYQNNSILTIDERGSLFTTPCVEFDNFEPSDVRTVVVATPRDTGVSLKSCFGKYVSRALKADRDAVSESEVFSIEVVEGGFTIRGDQYLSLNGPSFTSEPSILSIRIQRQNKTVQKKHKPRRTTKLELERMCGRQLNAEEVESLRKAELREELHERVLDLRVGSKSDKFG